MVLIAYHLLESNVGAYIEWLIDEIIMTQIEYKDACLVMLLIDAIIHKPDSITYP
jgi:hypothetical protein